jgi:hypothetical protein
MKVIPCHQTWSIINDILLLIDTTILHSIRPLMHSEKQKQNQWFLPQI